MEFVVYFGELEVGPVFTRYGLTIFLSYHITCNRLHFDMQQWIGDLLFAIEIY